MACAELYPIGTILWADDHALAHRITAAGIVHRVWTCAGRRPAPNILLQIVLFAPISRYEIEGTFLGQDASLALTPARATKMKLFTYRMPGRTAVPVSLSACVA